jgi:hypothetical protein
MKANLRSKLNREAVAGITIATAEKQQDVIAA